MPSRDTLIVLSGCDFSCAPDEHVFADFKNYLRFPFRGNVPSLETDNVVRVSVSDNGVGLEGVNRERMFTLSYTTKPSGTGVGLSISRSIAEAHGGRLWAEQDRNWWATFYFTVPVASAVASAQPPQEHEHVR